jgi:hypothetical protein
MTVDSLALSAVVTRFLEEAGVDLQRALELAAAEILCLQKVAGRGIYRNAVDCASVPRLKWIHETILGDDNAKAPNPPDERITRSNA